MRNDAHMIASSVVHASLTAPVAWMAWRSGRTPGVRRGKDLALGWSVVSGSSLLWAAALALPARPASGQLLAIVLQAAAAGASAAVVPFLVLGLRHLRVQRARRVPAEGVVPPTQWRDAGIAVACLSLAAFAAMLGWRLVALFTGDAGAVAVAAVGAQVATAPLVIVTLSLLAATAGEATEAAERPLGGGAEATVRTSGVFNAVLAAASDAVALVSPDGRFRASNAAFDALVQWWPEGSGTAEFPFRVPATPAHLEAWRDRFSAVAQGLSERFKRTVEVNGESRTYDIVISPAKVGDATDGALIWCRDVTEAEALQEALAGREAYYRSLIEHSSDMILVLRPDGTISYASPSATRVLGLAMDRVRRVPFADLAHRDDVATLLAAVAAAPRAAARRRPPTVRLRRADGSFVEVELAMSVFADPRGRRSVIINARDLTERRVLEQELLQAQRLDSLGRLAGGVAHDFNNLLTGLLAHVQFAQEEAADRPEALRELADVEATARRAAEVTRQLLTFARRDPIAPTVFDTNTRLREFARLLDRTVGERIRLVVTLAENPLPVRADPGQFEQAVLNLVVNARDAMPGGGTLTIATQRREGVSALDGRSAAVVSVTDTGSGISPDVQRHIFDPFFTTKPTGAGTGLGLASVYGMVTQAGGVVSVESRIGEGARFELVFPLHDAEDDAAEAPSGLTGAATGTPDTRATVLVVEDSPDVRRVTARLLERRGHRVLEADGAEAALATWDREAGAVDLLLTDVLMPGLSGVALAAQLRGRKPSLAVVFMTGGDADAVRRDPAGATGQVVAKPFTEEALSAAVRTALDPAAAPGRT